MKRSALIVILMGLLSQAAVAEVVRPDVAARYAADLMGVSSLTVSEKNTSRAPSRDGVTADPEYYVFNNPSGGWVIISAEDRVNPVIGYSDTGSFDLSDMPANLKWWMDGVAESINEVREKDMEAPASVRNAWRNLKSGRRAPASQKVLETANWDQEEPYTIYTPYINGENEHALVGCAATAISIIMRYHKWPERGHGQVGGYTTSNYPTYIPAYSLDNHVYNWDNMPLTDAAKKESAWTDAQIREVGQLMLDCGVMIQMDYSFDGSGAYSILMAELIKKHMSYAESATYLTRSSYKLDEWFQIMKNEIDADRVVYYTGNGNAGGHAFVCDGYDTDESMLHINWGWGGSCNGFFTLDLTANKNMQFPDDQAAIVGIVPDTETIDAPEVDPFIILERDGFMGIDVYDWVDLKKGSGLKFYIAYVFGTNSYEGNVEFKICLMDKEGNVKQEGWTTVKEFSKDDISIYALLTEETVLEVAPELTDYFQLFARKEGGSWKPVKGDRDALPDVDGIYFGVTPDPIIIVPDNCTAGQKIKPELTKGQGPVTKVTWKHNGKELESAELTLTQGVNEIRADVEYLNGNKGSIIRNVTVE